MEDHSLETERDLPINFPGSLESISAIRSRGISSMDRDLSLLSSCVDDDPWIFFCSIRFWQKASLFFRLLSAFFIRVLINFDDFLG